MHCFSEENIFVFLLQVFLLLGIARIAGELFRKWKQPALTAEILVGILLGPTILGRSLPEVHKFIFPDNPVQQNMLETVTWLGLMFFLLETGLKMDFSSAWRHRGKALTIALTDTLVPITLAFVSCQFLPDHYLVDPGQRFIFSLFMATVMCTTAMPIAARVLHDLDLSKTDLGLLIMSALSVNELIGWVIFTFILHSIYVVTNAKTTNTFVVFSMIILFIILCLSIGRRFTDFFVNKIKKLELPEPGSSLTFICLLGIFCGLVFQKIGVNVLIGFFIAGIMAGEAKALPERTRQVISQMVYAIFVPLFFAGIGLKFDFLKNIDLFLVLFVTGIGILGKFLGAWLGAKFSGLSAENCTPVAIAHTPGGSMEIVIGMIALQYNLISQSVFVAIVCGALISSVILGPWLKHFINKRKEISFLEFFSRGRIIPRLKATDRNGAIEELCTLISEQGNTPHTETIYSAVIKRENNMGTAIEEGVAIPHARLTSLVRPVIAFGRSDTGIEWNSPDGKPAHFIFLILTSRQDDWSQLQILRIIAKIMSSKQTRNALLKAEGVHDIWSILEHKFSNHAVKRKA